MCHKNRLIGFTLLEILIAIFIFTLISIIMMTGLHTVFNNQIVTEKKADKMTELQRSFLLISRDFEQAIDRPITNAKGILESTLVGTPRMVALTHAGVANPEGTLQRSTLQRVQYHLDQTALIRETWPVLDQVPKTQSNKRILLNSVTHLQFEYLDSTGKFQRNWPPANTPDAGFPKAIRISLELKNWGKISQLYLLPGKPFEKTPPTN